MEIVTAVAYAEVHDAYLRDHPVERAHEANTNVYGEENLERADKMAGGWWRVRLTRADVLGVVLPWHLSEGGELELVPRTGLTVAGAAERVRSGGAAWTAANPACAAKLRLLRRAPFTPLYLCTVPVDHPDYAELAVRSGLVHLDGLHRMLAWELAGRLPEAAELDGYLAGDPRVAARPAGTARTGDESA
ncbi:MULTISPECIES: DUF6309 family protein [Kitasatospora]|uniref:DUF6309 family protein n=1 Tax=Kitasatospora cathayae TaxID=3004092 RepID=A0ABY7PZ02_9ACTN|nr:DUF6309 family protein [Kitasatospora sp. HUAS 3-15]WBP85479.1 DUF6309 family protein [Kitasatospora sp. HUAS 3-15]